MTLKQTLERTCDHSQTLSSGCVVVTPSDATRGFYWQCSDYKVSTASAFTLYLVPVVVDKDRDGAMSMCAELGID